MPLAGDEIVAPDTAVRIASTPITADSATWTTTETGLLTATASLTSGWSYKITAFVMVTSTVAGDLSYIRIREDTSGGTQMTAANVYIPTTNGFGFPLHFSTEYTASSTASKSFVLTGARQTGATGTQKLVHSSSRLGFLTIDRIVS